MNCKEITQKVALVKSKKADLDKFINEGQREESLYAKTELANLIEEIKACESLEMKVRREGMEQNQNIFNQLDINVNIKNEYHEGNVVSLSKEESKAAIEAGFTSLLIVPGLLSMKEIVEKVGDKYTKIFSTSGDRPQKCSGVWFSSAMSQNMKYGEEMDYEFESKKRPEQYYELFYNPGKLKESFPETMDKGYANLSGMLSEKQTENPGLEIKGLNVQEYVLMDYLSWIKTGTHLDENYDCLLVENIYETERGKSILYAGWSKPYGAPGVGPRIEIWSKPASSNIPSNEGVRFVAIARQKE